MKFKLWLDAFYPGHYDFPYGAKHEEEPPEEGSKFYDEPWTVPDKWERSFKDNAAEHKKNLEQMYARAERDYAKADNPKERRKLFHLMLQWGRHLKDLEEKPEGFNAPWFDSDEPEYYRPQAHPTNPENWYDLGKNWEYPQAVSSEEEWNRLHDKGWEEAEEEVRKIKQELGYEPDYQPSEFEISTWPKEMQDRWHKAGTMSKQEFDRVINPLQYKKTAMSGGQHWATSPEFGRRAFERPVRKSPEVEGMPRGFHEPGTTQQRGTIQDKLNDLMGRFYSKEFSPEEEGPLLKRMNFLKQLVKMGHGDEDYK